MFFQAFDEICGNRRASLHLSLSDSLNAKIYDLYDTSKPSLTVEFDA